MSGIICMYHFGPQLVPTALDTLDVWMELEVQNNPNAIPYQTMDIDSRTVSPTSIPLGLPKASNFYGLLMDLKRTFYRFKKQYENGGT